jgi:hypothetical protein
VGVEAVDIRRENGVRERKDQEYSGIRRSPKVVRRKFRPRSLREHNHVL